MIFLYIKKKRGDILFLEDCNLQEVALVKEAHFYMTILGRVLS